MCVCVCVCVRERERKRKRRARTHTHTHTHSLYLSLSVLCLSLSLSPLSLFAPSACSLDCQPFLPPVISLLLLVCRCQRDQPAQERSRPRRSKLCCTTCLSFQKTRFAQIAAHAARAGHPGTWASLSAFAAQGSIAAWVFTSPKSDPSPLTLGPQNGSRYADTQVSFLCACASVCDCACASVCDCVCACVRASVCACVHVCMCCCCLGLLTYLLLLVCLPSPAVHLKVGQQARCFAVGVPPPRGKPLAHRALVWCRCFGVASPRTELCFALPNQNFKRPVHDNAGMEMFIRSKYVNGKVSCFQNSGRCSHSFFFFFFFFFVCVCVCVSFSWFFRVLGSFVFSPCSCFCATCAVARVSHPDCPLLHC